MKKTISFGKFAITSARRINAVDVMLDLRENEQGKPVFSASACAWNGRHTDWSMGGQCLDTIAERCKTLRHNPLYSEILGLWQRNHLNDMHAGTPAQEQAIKEWYASTGKVNGYYTYDETCEHLKSVGLYDDNGYKYGTGWLYREISDDDLKRIREIING